MIEYDYLKNRLEINHLQPCFRVISQNNYYVVIMVINVKEKMEEKSVRVDKMDKCNLK